MNHRQFAVTVLVSFMSGGLVVSWFGKEYEPPKVQTGVATPLTDKEFRTFAEGVLAERPLTFKPDGGKEWRVWVDSKMVVSINTTTGEVTIPPDSSLSEASLGFWRAVESSGPCKKEPLKLIPDDGTTMSNSIDWDGVKYQKRQLDALWAQRPKER